MNISSEILTHYEKQAVLYSKCHFESTDLMEDLRVIVAKAYDLPVEYTMPYSIYNFMLKLFFKLQKNDE